MGIKCAIFVALCTVSVARSDDQMASEKVRLTAEQAISVRELRDLRFSHDGSRLAFTVVEPPRGTEQASHVWIYSPGLRALRKFTNSNMSEMRPRWSPDGRTLAFLSNRENFLQIYLIPTDGGEATRLTEGKRSIETFEWSPDGRQIAFLAPEPKTEAEERKDQDKDDAISIDRDDKRTHLWLVEVESGKTRPLVGAPWHFSELQWRSNRLVGVATDHPESDQFVNRIYGINSADGKMREIAAPRGPFREVRISPDGSQISYIGSRIDGPSPHDLYVMTVNGAPKNLTAASIDRPVTSYQWQSERELIALVEDGFRSKLYTVGTDGRAAIIATPEMEVSGFSVTTSAAGVMVGQNLDRPPELWEWNSHAAPQRVSHFNASFDGFSLLKPEFVHYKSFDGRQIEAALLKPSESSAGSTLPAVILIHPGPTWYWSDSFDIFSSWGQLLAAAGYAVLYPNIRGSAGYGYDFFASNRGDWGGGDFKDVMAGADYLVSSGIADPKRLGIAGWSYGGYMAEWAITQTRRFKAAVSGAGMTDLAAEYGTEVGPAGDEWFYGLPYENPEGFRKSSPITYIKNARTPTLILQGEADVADPLSQSQMLYRALKRYGVETELVVYPRENHVLREEGHQLDVLRRVVAWFDEHLK